MVGEDKGNSAHRIWVLVDERPGTAAQTLGVADALGIVHEEIPLEWGSGAGLPNPLLGASQNGLSRAARKRLAPPWPDLVIAAGRRAGPVARYIKRQSGGRTFLAQLMYPGRSGAPEFDLIAVPNHDGLQPRRNFLGVTGAPHRVNEKSLQAAAQAWNPLLGHYDRPLVGLVVGGATRRKGFPRAQARDLGARAARFAAAAKGTLLVATSPRTGDEAADEIINGVRSEGITPGLIYRWGDEGVDNPYQGFLALSDLLIVTGDSVTMCSEACAGPGGVFIFSPPGFATAKHRRLHAELYELGLARPLEGKPLPSDFGSRPVLNTASVIAEVIRRRLDW